MLVAAGFVDVKIAVKENGRDIVKGWIPGSGAEKYVTSAYVTATKPRSTHGFRDAVLYGLGAPPAPPASAGGCCPPPAACCPPPSGGGSAKPAA